MKDDDPKELKLPYERRFSAPDLNADPIPQFVIENGVCKVNPEWENAPWGEVVYFHPKNVTRLRKP
jgi:hypothetical protein